MDVILLRTLTEKSIIGFGKYKDVRVGDLLKLDKTAELRWIYYNCSKITFIDEILDKIKIYPKYRIQKPGKDKELCDKVNTYMFALLSNSNPLKAIKVVAHIRKQYKRNLYRKRNSSFMTKRQMQALNHGKGINKKYI